MNTIPRTCPRCGKTYTEYPAISRQDNKTEICPACGQLEALEALKRYQEAKAEGGAANA